MVDYNEITLYVATANAVKKFCRGLSKLLYIKSLIHNELGERTRICADFRGSKSVKIGVNLRPFFPVLIENLAPVLGFGSKVKR
jgi:hypothetical protein